MSGAGEPADATAALAGAGSSGDGASNNGDLADSSPQTVQPSTDTEAPSAQEEMPSVALHQPNASDELQIREVLSHSTELEAAEDDVRAKSERSDEPVPGLRFLTGIMKATLFTDLFCYHAQIRFAHPSRQEKVAALIELHPKFYRATRIADFVSRAALMTIVVALTVGAGCASIYKLFLA